MATERFVSGSAGQAYVREPQAASQPISPSAALQMKLDASPLREFPFTTEDFERVRALLYQHTGIALSEIKQDMVYSRLTRRLRAKGDKTFAEYLARLDRGDKSEWESFINSMTTNLTSFFREAHHFDILAKQLKSITERRPIRIWCCAASTGEEAYSLAITAMETFSSLTPPVSIIASDLDTHVLMEGEAGIYSRERIEKLSPERISRYFMQGHGVPEGHVRVRPELQRLITFSRINLLDTYLPVAGPLDAIFCRNVMIYFDKKTQYNVLKKFVPLLRNEGLLFAGHSESFLQATDLFRSMGWTTYERADRRGG